MAARGEGQVPKNSQEERNLQRDPGSELVPVEPGGALRHDKRVQHNLQEKQRAEGVDPGKRVQGSVAEPWAQQIL